MPEFQLDKCSEREINWIYHSLYEGKNESHFINENIEIKRGILQRAMRSSEDNKEAILHFFNVKKSFLISSTDLSWIKEDNWRLLRWIQFHYYTMSLNTNIPPVILEKINVLLKTPISQFYKQFIFELDTWNTPTNEKLSFLKRLKDSWGRILENSEKLKWINPDLRDQIDWIWLYMQKKLDVSMLKPHNTEEKYSFIMSLFECWRGHPLELKELQGNIRKGWAQQKYRKSLSGKKQSTFVLSIEAKDQLQKLADDAGINLHKMLERLIKHEFEHKKRQVKSSKS